MFTPPTLNGFFCKSWGLVWPPLTREAKYGLSTLSIGGYNKPPIFCLLLGKITVPYCVSYINACYHGEHNSEISVNRGTVQSTKLGFEYFGTGKADAYCTIPKSRVFFLLFFSECIKQLCNFFNGCKSV